MPESSRRRGPSRRQERVSIRCRQRPRNTAGSILPFSPFCLRSDLITAQLTLSGSDPIPLHLPASIPTSSIHLLESFESSHSSHSTSSIIASNLTITHPPIRMDSQAKYGVLARTRNGGGIYLRMPTGIGYREKIWVSETSGCLVSCCWKFPGPRPWSTHCRGSWWNRNRL